MTAIDDEERTLDDDENGGDAAEGLTCPECGEGPFSGPLALGGHRFHKHGVRSLKPKKGKASTGMGRPRGRPRTTPLGDSESGRQARRRKAVKETLIEFVDFSDATRGRGEPTPVDLADLIRRDADGLANSIAWTAERFNPLGRLIDVTFGHGSVLTVARGFSGLGAWLLRRWRQLIEERQSGEFVPPLGTSAEEIDEQMQRAYLS